MALLALQAVQALKLESLISEEHWDTFARFLLKVESKYNAVPYHSATHAADVTARTAALLYNSGIWQEEQDEDTQLQMLACVLAAVVHDVGHPGALL